MMISSLAVVLLGGAIATTSCEALKNVSLPDTTITAAEFVLEGEFKPVQAPRAPNAPAPAAPPAPIIIAPAHYRVVAVLKPSSDSLINMELWLPPADKWNGKFEAVGNGGWAGYILCPHPQVATYKGSGDTNDAAYFVCK